MEEISAMLVKRQEYINQILIECSAYIDITGEKIRGDNPADWLYINESSNLLKNISECLLLCRLDSFEDAIKMFDDFYNIEYRMSKMLYIMSNPRYQKLIVHKMSATYSNSAQIILERAQTLFLKYKKFTGDDDELIIKHVISTITSDLYNSIITLNNTNKLTTAITIKLMGEVSDTKRHKLMQKIEGQKNQALNTKRIHVCAIGLQQQAIFANLQPGVSGEKPVEDTTVGYIYIPKTSRSPIEFDMRALLDQEYIAQEGYDIDPLQGLTAKTVHKYNTTRSLGVTTGMPAKIEIVRPDSKYFRIYDSLNGLLWRPWYHPATKTDLIHRTYIQSFLDGISTRADDYNRIMEASIIAKWHDTRAETTLAEWKTHKEVVASEQIIAKIIDRLTNWFKSELLARKPTSVDAVKAIEYSTHAKFIIDTLVKEQSDIHKSSERILTYLVKYDALLTTFAKELKYKWGNTEIPKTVFEQYDDPYEEIASYFNRAVKAVVESIDRTKGWTSIEDSLKQYYLEYNYLY